MTEVGLVAAFFAGILTLVSPCSALLLPSFFAYAFGSRRALVARTLVFYLGLLMTLVPLGAGASVASTLFYGHRTALIAVAGWLIVAMGVLQLLGGGFTIPGVQRLQGVVSARAGDGWISTALLGAVYGLAGFCSGPVLGAILTVAATRPQPWQGAGLLAVYALGMAAPLLVLAALWDRFELGRRGWLRGRRLELGPLRMHTTSLVSGALFILVGVVFLRYEGTAGLTGVLGFGDLTDLEYAAQRSVTDWAAAVPAWVGPVVVLVGALVVAWRRRGPTDRGRDADHDDGGSGDRRVRARGPAAPR